MVVSNVLFWNKVLFWLFNIVLLGHILYTMTVYTTRCEVLSKTPTSRISTVLKWVTYCTWLLVNNIEEDSHFKILTVSTYTKNIQQIMWKIPPTPWWIRSSVWNKALLEFNRSPLNCRINGPCNKTVLINWLIKLFQLNKPFSNLFSL